MLVKTYSSIIKLFLGWTPLHSAAIRSLEIVKCLVSHKAILEEKSKSGKKINQITFINLPYQVTIDFIIKIRNLKTNIKTRNLSQNNYIQCDCVCGRELAMIIL